MAGKRDRERANADKKAARQEKMVEVTEKRRDAQDTEAGEGEHSPPAEVPAEVAPDASP